MAEDQQENPNQDFPDSSDNSSFTPKEDSLNTASQEVQAENKSSQDDKKDCYSHPNIIINTPANNDIRSLEEARKANRISRTGLIINTALLVCTLGALAFTWWSISLTKESVDVSKQALATSIKKDKEDSLNRIKYDAIARDERDSVNKRANASYNLARQSLDEQINSLNQSQQQYKIGNAPYLQVFNPTFGEISPNKTVYLRYLLKNYGALPAVIINQEVGSGYCYKKDFNAYREDPFKYLKFTKDPVYGSIYIAKESTDTLILSIPYSFNEKNFFALMNGEVIIFMYGKYNYSSPIYKNEVYEYKFALYFIWTPNPNKGVGNWTMSYEFAHNERRLLEMGKN